jgi:O-antigen ligase
MGNWQIVLGAAKREPLLPALLAVAMLSSLWSFEPAQTFQVSLVLFVTYLTGLYFVIRYSIREILAMSSWVLLACLLASFLLIFGFPEGVSPIGDWTGVFSSRNSLARLAVVSALVFVLHARQSKSQFFWFACAGLCVTQVLGSGSATSLGALGGLAFLTIGMRGFRGRKTLYGATAMMMAATFTALVIITASNFEFALGLLDRETTITGRLPLWQNSFRFGILREPWLGHGWSAFWNDGAGRDFEIVLRSRFTPPHAHNAFVDAWLYAGPLAVGLLFAIYCRGLYWGARAVRASPTPSGLFQPLMISAAVIYSLSETGFIGRSILFILLVVAVTAAGEHKGTPQPFDLAVSPDGRTDGSSHP